MCRICVFCINATLEVMDGWMCVLRTVETALFRQFQFYRDIKKIPLLFPPLSGFLIMDGFRRASTERALHNIISRVIRDLFA